MRRPVRWLIAASLLLAGSEAIAAESITLMVAGLDKQIYLPARIAERLGYFRETGLPIEIRSEPAGSSAERELLLGAAQGVVGFYDHTIALQARGKLVQSVVLLGAVPGEAVVVARKAAAEIRSPADFRGRTIGVTALGSSTNHLTKYLAAKAGVKSGEFRIVPVGAGDTFIGAMREGRISAGMTTEPTVSRLVAAGAADILVDLRSVAGTQAALGGPYPGACLYMPTAWVDKNREAVQQIVGAFVKALRYLREHSAEEIAALLPPDFAGADRRRYVEALEISRRGFTADGLMPDGGPPMVLRILTDFDRTLGGKSINLANTYTNEFVSASLR